MRTHQFRRFKILTVLSCCLVSCADEAKTPRGMEAQDIFRPTVSTDAAIQDATASPDRAFLQTGCASDDVCPGEEICYDGRCVEGIRCQEGGRCPQGQICVGGLCFEAPPGTQMSLSFDPNRIGFTFDQAGQTIARQVTLNNADTRPITLMRLRVEGAQSFTVENPPQLPLVLGPNRQETITVTYTADDTIPDEATLIGEAGEHQARLIMVSSHKPTIPTQPCLETTPRQLLFGGIRRGDTGQQTFQLRACSDVPVTINTIERGRSFLGELPDTFQLDQPPQFPLVLQPGQTQMITVSYTPRRAGLEFGFWNIASDDGAEPEQRVDMTAIAEPPELENVEFHVRMRWTTDLTDVDLHLVGPAGPLWSCEGDCFFSNAGPNWGDQNRFEDDPFLDLDDVDGFGPENINLQSPEPVRYHIFVHYWSDHGGDSPDVEVEILQFGQVVAQFGPQRLENVDDLWSVATVDFPAFQVTPVDQMVNMPRGRVCGGF